MLVEATPATLPSRLLRGALATVLSCLFAAAVAGSASAQVASQPDVLVTPGGEETRSFQSPQLAVDPTNQNRLSISYQELQRGEACFLARSQDGGRTWQNQRVVGEGTPYPLPPNYKQCYDPMVAYGPDGTLYYEYQPYPGTNPLGQRKTFITASRRGGAFEAPREVDPPEEGEPDRTDLYSEMAVDQRSGNVYLSWGRFCEPSVPGPIGLLECQPTPGQLQVTSSSDGARTFSEPVTVNPPTSPDPARNSVAVDAAGTVYAAWIDGFLTAGRPGAPPPKLFAATSRDGAKSFGQPVQIAETEKCTGKLCYSPDAGGGGFIDVVGGAAGQASLVGWDRRGGDKNRVFFTQTSNSGQSWSTPRVVGIPAGGQAHQQHHPSMAVGPQGRIYILYYDYSPDEGVHRVYLIQSDDGGRSFSTPAKLSDVPSNAKIGPYIHGAEEDEDLANFGQRIGVAATLGGPLAAWTDSRLGNKKNARQDIFFENRSTGPAGTPPAGTPPSGTAPSGSPPAGDDCGKFTAKLSLARATFSRSKRTISILAPITRRASGSVRITLRAARRTITFGAPIDSKKGRIRVTRKIPAAQARLGTGILTIRYRGDGDTRPQNLRVRAANNPARLKVRGPTISRDGFLRANGTVSRKARGVVRVKIQYVNRADGQTVLLERAALIRKGRWGVNRKLSPSLRRQIAQRCGSVHSYTLFTGSFPRRIRGEQRSLQVLPAAP